MKEQRRIHDFWRVSIMAQPADRDAVRRIPWPVVQHSARTLLEGALRGPYGP